MGSRVGFLWDSISNNTGDEAIGETLLRLAQLQGINAIEPVDLLHWGTRPDLLIIGGGELLHPEGHGFYDTFRVPGEHILCSAGIAGSQDVEFLRDYRLLSVRSEADRSNLRGLAREVRVAPCLSLLFDQVVKDKGTVDMADGLVGLQLNAASLEPYEGPRVIQMLQRHLMCPVAFIPFTHYNQDIHFQEVLANELGAAPPLNLHGPDEAFSAVRRLRAIITTSLHATLFAYMAGVPFLAIPYSPKVENFLKERDLENRRLESLTEIGSRLDLLEPDSVDWGNQLVADQAAAKCLLQDIFTEVESTLNSNAQGGSDYKAWQPPLHRIHAHSQMMENARGYGDGIASRLELTCALSKTENMLHKIKKELRFAGEHIADLGTQLTKSQSS